MKNLAMHECFNSCPGSYSIGLVPERNSCFLATLLKHPVERLTDWLIFSNHIGYYVGLWPIFGIRWTTINVVTARPFEDTCHCSKSSKAIPIQWEHHDLCKSAIRNDKQLKSVQDHQDPLLSTWTLLWGPHYTPTIYTCIWNKWRCYNTANKSIIIM